MRFSLKNNIYWASLVLAILQIALVLTSWLLTAAMPDMPYRSLLNPSGIRWFLHNYSVKMSSPLLLHMILVAVAIGSFVNGGLWSALNQLFTKKRSEITSQQSFGLTTALGLLIIEVLVLLALTFLPNAILLSITGKIYPSSLSEGIVPILAFMVISISIAYSLFSGRFHSVYEVGESMTSACEWLMPFLLLYLFGAVFYHSFIYVFII